MVFNYYELKFKTKTKKNEFNGHHLLSVHNMWM